jgi:hypothetical protein
MITPPDETYSTAQAASLLGMSERQCARYLEAGLLIRTALPGDSWGIPELPEL